LKKSPTCISKKSLRPGSIVFGPNRETTKNIQVYSRLFRCRKDGFDFMGQIRIDVQGTKIALEVFNAKYFDSFDVSKNQVLESLEKLLLGKLISEKKIPVTLRETICVYLSEKKFKGEPLLKVETIGDHEINLKEMFDQLNAEYFGNKIKANIEWGKIVNKKNLTSFRFGSYDPGKQLIRIHPRLQQSFVPLSVLELTIYHEMCHQWAPMKRKKGMWLVHHSQFKEKERCYRFYKEARSWEKENWKKLMEPSRVDLVKENVVTPALANDIFEIKTLAG
jgi:hypothetical protein